MPEDCFTSFVMKNPHHEFLFGMEHKKIAQNEISYPAELWEHLKVEAPSFISLSGNPDLLQKKPLALFSSIKCPGKLILKTYDLAQRLRDERVPVIGGFHSPMEKECLLILLRGTQPVIVCPNRGISGMRIPANWKRAIAEGRLLIVSPLMKNSAGEPFKQPFIETNS
jgi:predicted Rossmann fold nucleotide-binding protein DprA/Smf involved in DNA uptake